MGSLAIVEVAYYATPAARCSPPPVDASAVGGLGQEAPRGAPTGGVHATHTPARLKPEGAAQRLAVLHTEALPAQPASRSIMRATATENLSRRSAGSCTRHPEDAG